MTDRTNRRDLIIESAARLFEQQGYTATSVRQIADEVGCTEAALYYHFKEGKRELLKCVIECEYPNLEAVLDACREATSLHELILRYGEAMAKIAPPRMRKMRWILSEFPNLSPEEQAFVQNKHIRYHDEMTALMAQFVDPGAADRLAWLLQCTGLGYGQLFWNLNLRSRVDFPTAEMIAALADLFGSQG